MRLIDVTDKDKLDFRYERFWLPVLQQYSNNAEEDLTLEPPEDVKWVWHVHLLAPNAYSQDMKQSALARIPSFNLKPDKNKQRKRRAKNFWEELFPDEPYEAKAGQRPEIFPPSDFSYDIVAAAERQKVFFYQVSLPIIEMKTSSNLQSVATISISFYSSKTRTSSSCPATTWTSCGTPTRSTTWPTSRTP